MYDHKYCKGDLIGEGASTIYRYSTLQPICVIYKEKRIEELKVELECNWLINCAYASRVAVVVGDIYLHLVTRIWRP